MRYFVTGCAGFIGSTLTDRLLEDGHEVVGFDNFSTGRRDFLRRALEHTRFRLVRGDVLDTPSLSQAMEGTERVCHLAANADVRFGTDHPRKDLEQNTIATHSVLEAMRLSGTRQIAFASTGSVYGEPAVFPTPEDAPFPVQTSLYAASKVAGEGLVGAYCAGFGFQAWIFRFVSVLGERYTHGHVVDFHRQLTRHPQELHVLGNGRQRKSYLHVQDCVSGMMAGMQGGRDSVNVFNLGHDTYCELKDSIGWICGVLGLRPKVLYEGGERGWVGDSPFIFLATERLRALGWAPTLSIQESIERTVRDLRTRSGNADTYP